MNYIFGDKKPTAEEIEKQVPTEWMSDKSPPASYDESIDKLKHDNLCYELTKEIFLTSKDKVPPKIRKLAEKLRPLLPKVDRYWGGKKSKKNRKKKKKSKSKKRRSRRGGGSPCPKSICPCPGYFGKDRKMCVEKRATGRGAWFNYKHGQGKTYDERRNFVDANEDLKRDRKEFFEEGKAIKAKQAAERKINEAGFSKLAEKDTLEGNAAFLAQKFGVKSILGGRRRKKSKKNRKKSKKNRKKSKKNRKKSKRRR